MGYVEVRKQSQQNVDEEKPKSRWVSCPDMPDGLMTVDDETPHKTPQWHYPDNIDDSHQD